MKQKTSPKRLVLELLCTFLLFSGILLEATGSVFFEAERPQRERLFQHVAMVPLGPNIHPKGCATRQETWEGIFRGKNQRHPKFFRFVFEVCSFQLFLAE